MWVPRLLVTAIEPLNAISIKFLVGIKKKKSSKRGFHENRLSGR
jgi:hypothetical protein